VLAIAAPETRKRLALRRPKSWPRAFGWMAIVLVAVYVVAGVLSPFLDAGGEQGLTPDHWRPDRATPFALNFAVIALAAPIAEELTFRGLGYGLLERFGPAVAILVVGITFGLAHGLVDALPILAAFGVGLAVIRYRTDSVYPGILLHALFNSIALTLAVTT
jgi:membrane protease YdiL (CAAX protease family)